jgi:hypothetical protein
MMDQYGLKCNSSNEIYCSSVNIKFYWKILSNSEDQACKLMDMNDLIMHVLYSLHVIAHTYLGIMKFGLLLIFV